MKKKTKKETKVLIKAELPKSGDEAMKQKNEQSKHELNMYLISCDK